MSRESAVVIVISLLLIAIVAIGLPRCAKDEVLVRGTWGYVCVVGHR